MARTETNEVILSKPAFGDVLLMNAAILCSGLLVLFLIGLGYYVADNIAAASFGRISPDSAHLIGGFLGFVIGAPIAGTIRMVQEIERNTRHTALMFEKLAMRREQSP
jgi:hypothetical protein